MLSNESTLFFFHIVIKDSGGVQCPQAYKLESMSNRIPAHRSTHKEHLALSNVAMYTVYNSGMERATEG